MPDLTVVMAHASPERFRTALALSTAAAALGGRARIFLEGEAVALLCRPIAGPADTVHAAAGLPTLDAHVAAARDLGVRFIACQSGLALTGLTPADLDPATDYAGMIGLLADLGDDRLVVV